MIYYYTRTGLGFEQNSGGCVRSEIKKGFIRQGRRIYKALGKGGKAKLLLVKDREKSKVGGV
jgi:hypothetical protein